MSPVMNEATLLRLLRGFKKVRGPDFHQPAMRSSKSSMENGGGLEKRHPLSKQERAEAEKLLSAGGVTRSTEEQAEEVASKAIAVAADDGSATLSSEPGSADRAPGDERERARLDVIDPANFFKEFDAWVDSKYPGDRGSATKVKVAFRKQHRATVNSLCLEDIEDIAQAMQ